MPNQHMQFYENIMGQELSQVFWKLTNKFYNLSFLYDDCTHLFGEQSAARVDMLNKTAPAFFCRVQIVFEQELMLGICRATDPVKTGKSNNLTVLRLATLVEQSLIGKSDGIDILAKSARDASEFARDWRNKRIAHNDFELSINAPSAKLLPDATLGKIDISLAALDKVLVATLSAFDCQVGSFRGTKQFGGSASLISIIDDGLRGRDLRNAEFKV